MNPLKGVVLMISKNFEGISVIVPVYNNEKCLPRCIDSILNQSYRNLEIICIDDGSTDGSANILDSYAKKDCRVKVIHKENSGVSAARNTGIEVSSMPIIAFVDSDDFIEADMYDKMISLMVKENLECVCCDYKNVYTDKTINKNSRFNKQILYGNQIREEIVKGIIGFFNTNNNCLTSVCNRLFIREKLIENNMWFDENRAYGEDWLFCIEYYRVINSIGFLNECMYSYVHQDGSLSTKARTDYFEYAVINNKLFNKMFPEFDWNCETKVKQYNNRPIEAAMYYKRRFDKEKSNELIKNIFYICKGNDYYKNSCDLTKNQQKLKKELDNNNVDGFVKVLHKITQREKFSYLVKMVIKKIKK